MKKKNCRLECGSPGCRPCSSAGVSRPRNRRNRKRRPRSRPRRRRSTIKFAVGGPETLPIYRAAKDYFKPQIEEKSKGKMKVELYPSSQLGDDVKLIESIRSGTLEATGPYLGAPRRHRAGSGHFRHSFPFQEREDRGLHPRRQNRPDPERKGSKKKGSTISRGRKWVSATSRTASVK